MRKNGLFLTLLFFCIFQLQVKSAYCASETKPTFSDDLFKPPLTSDELNQIGKSVSKQIVWDAYWHPESNLTKNKKSKKYHILLTAGLSSDPEMIRAYVDEIQSIFVLYRDKLFVNWSVEYRGRSLPDDYYLDRKKKILKSIPLEIFVNENGPNILREKWTNEKTEMVEQFLEKDNSNHSENPNSKVVITCPDANYPRLLYYVPERQYLGEIIFDPEKKSVLYDDDNFVGEVLKANKVTMEIVSKIKKNGKWFKLKNKKFEPADLANQ